MYLEVVIINDMCRLSLIVPVATDHSSVDVLQKKFVRELAVLVDVLFEETFQPFSQEKWFAF